MIQKLLTFLARLILIAFAILVFVLLIFDQFVQFRMNDKDLIAYFDKKGIDPELDYFTTHNRKIRYLINGEDTASASLLFLHGAPSSMSYWRDFLTDSSLLKRAKLFSLDRPGYGYSGLGNPLPDIHQQSIIIKSLIDSVFHPKHPFIVVGASYGTSIACRLAMDYPELVDGLVLIAPALAPGEEKVFWFTNTIENPLLNWFIPRMFQSANQEKIYHKEELTKMLPLWNNIRVPVIYLQGEKDDLVYTTNAAFARDHLQKVPYLDIQMIPGRGHLIAFSEKGKIKTAIEKMLALCKSRD